jgi:outer membrane protein assembly factor BamB
MYRSHWGLHAVPLQSGDLEWESPSAWSLDRMTLGGGRKSNAIHSWMQFYLQPGMQMRCAAILLLASTTGTLTTDGKFVYGVEDLQVPPPAGVNAKAYGGNYIPLRGMTDTIAEIRDAIQHSRLQAIEIATGKLKWELGDPNRNDGLGDYFFRGPPVSAGGYIYVLGLRKTDLPTAALLSSPGLALAPFAGSFWETNLLCIEPGPPGKLQSSHHLAAGFEAGNPLARRIHAAHLVVAGDTLVCPTDSGIVVGFDLRTNKRLWEYSYRDKADERETLKNLALSDGGCSWWKDSSLTIQGDKVIFNAADSRSVHCVRLRDGAPLWKISRTSDDLHLAGAVADTVLIVGKKTVRGVRLTTGAKVWEIAAGLPSGHGAVRNGLFYLPLQADADGKGAEMRIFDVTAGRVAARFSFPDNQAPGNLFFFGDRLVSQSAREIAVYPVPQVKSRP